MGLAHVVVGADQAALEHREEVLSGVGMLEAAGGDVFLGAVVHDRVTVKLAAYAGVNGGFVGHQVCAAMDVGDDQAAHVLGIDVGDMERAGAAIALDKGNHDLLGGGLAEGAVLGLAADIGFVGFDNAVRTAAKRIVTVSAVHGLADAVGHEPCRLVGDAERAVKLVGAETLLAARHEAEGEKPLVQGDFRSFEDRADRDREGLAAGIAHNHAGACALALQAGDALCLAALGAHWAVGPVQGFKMLAGLVGIAVDRIGEVEHDAISICSPRCYVKYIIAHLHPRAIHAIREVLSDVGADYQVIVTTHSPLLANRQSIEANVIVRSNNAFVAQDISEIRDALGVRVSDNLSHARVVLVCEGSEDESFLRKCLSDASETVKAALISGELSVYPLAGAGKLSYVLTLLQQSVSAPVCFLDNDKSARDAADGVVSDDLLPRHEFVFARKIGLAESELEDLYDEIETRKLILEEFKIDIQQIRPGERKRKFSDRVAAAFAIQGKDFDKSTKMILKAKLSHFASQKGLQFIPEHSRGPINTLVLQLKDTLGTQS